MRGVMMMVPWWLAACDPTTVTVGRVVVVQSIQDDAHSVPLIARRATTIRAEVLGVDGAAPPAGLSATAHVWVDGVEVTPASGVAAVNQPFSGPLTPDQANEGDWLYFELTAPTAITASADVDVEVRVSTGGEMAVGRADDLTFGAPLDHRVFYTRINYLPAGLGVPTPAQVAPGFADAFYRGIYPVDESDPAIYQEGLFPTLTFNEDDNGDGILDGCAAAGDDAEQLLALLDACRQLIVDNGLGADDKTHLYGWLAGNPINGNGCGNTPGKVAYGNTQDIRFQRTFAHEVGHNYGLNHNNNATGMIGWDTTARLVGNPAGNNVAGRVKGSTLWDIMVGGQLTSSAWVAPASFGTFDAATGADADSVEGSIVLRGVFGEGPSDLTLLPAFRYAWRAPAPKREQVGRYTIVVTDVSGAEQRATTDAVTSDDGDPGLEDVGMFSVTVPLDPQVAVARVEVLLDGQPIAERRASEPPYVDVFEPAAGSTLDGPFEVAWEAQDDSSQKDWEFQVAWSWDDGASWSPIAVGLSGDVRSIRVDPRELKASGKEGGGQVRVMMSDGLLSASDEVVELSSPNGR